jgi:RNA-directed DNA polymerase
MAKVNAAHLFRKSFSPSALKNTYSSRLTESRAVGLDRVDSKHFAANLAIELGLISKKVLAGSYEFTKYKEKLISRGAEKLPRQLSIPTIRDRVTLRALCDYLFEVFPEAKPELPQAKIDTLKNAVDSGKYTKFIRIDLQDFYSSLDHKLLLSRVGMRARSPFLRRLLLSAMNNPTVAEAASGSAEDRKRGVAQGLAISNVLAEIFMLEVDRRIAGTVPIYLRYVDDIIILTDGDAISQCAQVMKILRQSKLVPHPIDTPGSKSIHGVAGDGFTYLGYFVRPKRVTVKPSGVLTFEGSLVEAFVEYRHRLRRSATLTEREATMARFRWNLNLKLTGCIYKGQRFGWIFYYSQITDLSVLHRVDHTVRQLFARFNISMPPNPKRAVKAFFEAKRIDKSTHRYIPNYDSLDVPGMRTFLGQIGVNVSGLPDNEVEILFSRVIRRATHKLEKDVSHVS